MRKQQQKRNRQSDIVEKVKEYVNQGNILKRRHAIMKLGYQKRMKHEIEMLSYKSEIKS